MTLDEQARLALGWWWLARPPQTITVEAYSYCHARQIVACLYSRHAKN